MKPLNALELANYVAWINPQARGAQLQDVYTDGEILVLELYKRRADDEAGGAQFLLVDLRPAQPYFVFISEQKFSLQKKSQKPVALFLASHGENLFLDEFEISPEKGRVLKLIFRNQTRSCEIEIVLIPHAVNVVVSAGEKQVSWNRPKAIPEGHALSGVAVEREWTQFASEFLSWRWPAHSAGPVSDDKAKKSLERALEKKKAAIEKISAGLDGSVEERWRAFGDALKISKDCPAEFSDLWDSKLNLRDNRERAFKKAKEQAAKRAGAEERIRIMRTEIETLERKRDQPSTDPPTEKSTGIGTRILRKTESKGRSFNLNSGAQAVVGRSAKDNLALLRQARAWDYWLHLKDEPSAHAIIFRNKNQSIPREELAEVAQWILQASSGKKLRLAGSKIDVVVVECRFVRPIKGDRLGRVTYHSPTVHSIVIPNR